jgi:membrane protease YdiL (CAAX protease family)
MVQEYIHTSKYLSILVIGIIAPIIEELTFRKAFRDIFKNDLAFILTSGLVFGALHVVLSFNSLWDLLYIIPYSSLGIAFAITYSKTNNIYSTIFMHIFHNTVLTILSVIAGVGVILL